MKLSEILTEVRSGAMIFNISAPDASKVISNAKGELSYASTLFQKKYVSHSKGDEIVQSGKKQTNVSEIERIIRANSGTEMKIRIGKIDYIGLIDVKG